MKGKTVAAGLGSNYAKVLKEFDPKNEIKLVTFEGMDVVVNSVAQGKWMSHPVNYGQTGH